MPTPKLIHVLFIIQLPFFLFAQTGTHTFIGARNEALANAVVADDSINTVFSNPAGLSSLRKSAVIASFQKLYAIKDLQTASLAAIIPTNSNVFGITIHHSGIPNYSEQSIGIAYAKKFFPKLSAAIRLNGNIINAREYGSHFFFTFDFGLNTLIYKDLNIGFYIQNPISSTKINSEVNTTSIFHLGGAYRVNEKVKMLVEIEKPLLYPTAYKIGVEYGAVSNITLRGGFSSYPMRMSFGVGFQWLKNWVIDCALSSHSVLGLTPAASLIYVFKKNR